MKRSEDRILTTHVGSLIRPAELLEALAAAKSGSTTEQRHYEKVLRSSVADVVRKQAEVGIDIVSDGEFGKSNWATYVLERVSGYELRPNDIRPLDWLGRDRQRFPEFFAAEMPMAVTGAPTMMCVAPIEHRDKDSGLRDVDNLKAALATVDGVDGFLPVVAPASAAYNGANEYYPNDREYVYALADALKVEYQTVYKAGLLLQVDDAVLANMYDHLVQTSPERYKEWAGLRVEALNHALAGIPEEQIRYHICFGSWHVPHVADAPLEEIADLMLSVRAGAYSVEAANPRHEHEWRVWQNGRLPDGKILIPGVVAHHLTTVEHPQLVADRIVRFAELVGRSNVIAGTDCGFAQSQATQRVHPTIMWAKFASLVEGARIASEQLWK